MRNAQTYFVKFKYYLQSHIFFFVCYSRSKVCLNLLLGLWLFPSSSSPKILLSIHYVVLLTIVYKFYFQFSPLIYAQLLEWSSKDSTVSVMFNFCRPSLVSSSQLILAFFDLNTKQFLSESVFVHSIDVSIEFQAYLVQASVNLSVAVQRSAVIYSDIKNKYINTQTYF